MKQIDKLTDIILTPLVVIPKTEKTTGTGQSLAPFSDTPPFRHNVQCVYLIPKWATALLNRFCSFYRQMGDFSIRLPYPQIGDHHNVLPIPKRAAWTHIHFPKSATYQYVFLIPKWATFQFSIETFAPSAKLMSKPTFLSYPQMGDHLSQYIFALSQNQCLFETFTLSPKGRLIYTFDLSPNERSPFSIRYDLPPNRRLPFLIQRFLLFGLNPPIGSHHSQ